MGSISNPQVEIVDHTGDGDVVQISDGALFTKKLNVLAPGDAAATAKGLILLGLDPSNNAKQLLFDGTGNLKVTGVGGGFSGQLVLDGQLAAPLVDTGRIAVGFDGTNYQFIKTDAAGELQVDVLSWLGSTAPTVGQKANASSLPVTMSTDQMYLELTSILAKQGVGVLGNDSGTFRWLKVDATGALQIAIAPSPNTFFNFGDVATTVLGLFSVRRTVYTEQTTDAQRSIASASALDTNAAGTGARTVKITYFDATGAGPFSETVALNGVAFVNTVATNICFIEKMVVVTVGSTGSNAGILTLRAAAGGGGVVIGTVGATDNQTYWAHHYVGTGLTMKLTGISCSHNGTTVGSGAVFHIRAKLLGAITPDLQVSDFVRLYGQSSTFSRTYNSPITIPGPARVVMYVSPETATSVIYRSAMDYNEA